MKKTTTLLKLALAAAVLTACDTGTEPLDLDTFDAEAALDDYQAMDAIMDTEGWRGFLAMGNTVSLETFGPAVQGALTSARDLGDLRGSEASGRYAAGLARLALHASNAPLISETNRGKTFVYDPAIGDYRADETLTGAPANGVRIVVYREVGGVPDVNRPIGHADLIDNGDGSAADIALRLVVVEGDRTVLDYAFTLDENAGQGRATLDGFVRGDADQMDFRIDVTGSEGSDAGTFDADFRIAVPNRDFSIEGSVTHRTSGARETASIDLTVRHGSHTLGVDVAGTDSTIEGDILLNGDLFVSIGGHPDNPTFTKPDGELTQADILVLHRVVDVVEDVFDFLEDLMDPVDEIVLLAVLL